MNGDMAAVSVRHVAYEVVGTDDILRALERLRAHERSSRRNGTKAAGAGGAHFILRGDRL